MVEHVVFIRALGASTTVSLGQNEDLLKHGKNGITERHQNCRVVYLSPQR